MPRRPRSGSGAQIFHVLNRGVRRSRLFDTAAQYARFEQMLIEARTRFPVRLHNFCLMPSHFHLVVWPREVVQLSDFMRCLTGAHARRRHAEMGSLGTGPIYQGRFKSFPVQGGLHFLRVSRYVERNALRARLCERAEDWRWSSLWHYCNNSDLFVPDEWPVPRPSNWLEDLNRGDDADIEGVRQSVRTGRPYGEGEWGGAHAGTGCNPVPGTCP
jgi:putative transposase